VLISAMRCAFLDVLIGQARTHLRLCRPELPLGVIEVDAAAPFIAALRPAACRGDDRTMSIALYRAALHSAFLILPMDMPRQITTKSSSQR
jgi:hypothetical protein